MWGRVASLVLLVIGADATNYTAETTFYGAKDNCPPGGDIAHPKIHKLVGRHARQTFKRSRGGCHADAIVPNTPSNSTHCQAGGTGTYADPITYAGATKATPAGTIIYVHSDHVKRYFIMEDDVRRAPCELSATVCVGKMGGCSPTFSRAERPCPATPRPHPPDQCEECISDWSKGKWHVDLWMGPTTIQSGPDLIACENALTLSKTTIETNPPATYPVITTPLYNNVTRTCIVPSTPCTDVGNECGNSCDALPAGTCAQIEAILFLNDTRFKQVGAAGRGGWGGGGLGVARQGIGAAWADRRGAAPPPFPHATTPQFLAAQPVD